jgi:hypothetical protein
LDVQILDAARSYLAAARRLAKPEPHAQGAPNVLVFPALHCAVIACELFLKSTSAHQVGQARDGFTVQRIFAKPTSRSHNILIQDIDTAIGTRVIERLSEDERQFLNDLATPLQASRYPYEHDHRDHDCDRAIALAAKLDQIISDALSPDAEGRIHL